MKTRMTIFVSLLLAGFTFTSCDDNDDNYTPDEKIVNVLYEKYPNAQRVDWKLQHDHYVADFYDNKIEKEAWITTKGEWVMTESDILFNNLPDAVQTAFNESEYKDWQREDVDMLERIEMETVYVIEVEKSKQEFDLFYAEDGTLIKAVEDIDNNNNYQPNMVPEVLKNFINEKYPQATIVDIEVEKGITEIDILHDEAVTYAEALTAAGITVQLNEVSGSYHGFDAESDNAFVSRVIQRRLCAMKTMLESSSRQPRP